MEICEAFEEWDGSDIEAIDAVEGLLLEEEDNEEEESAQAKLGDDEADGSDDEDEDESSLKCSKCKKVYHTMGWLKRHELSCSGAKGKAQKTQVLSDHQTKTRKILADLGFEEYFDRECLSAIVNCLQEITSTPNEIVKLRGARFAECKQQAEFLAAELKRGKNDASGVIGFCAYVAKTLWMITFARDQLLSTSTRHEHVAQHLHQFRQSEELSIKWTEICRRGLNPVDKLLLQKLVSLIFADISRHRSEAVASALQLRKTYVGETPNKPFLTPVEESVIAYIAGYVGRKTRDRLQRYHDHSANLRSTQDKKSCKRERLECIITILREMIPGGQNQTVAMTYPNLMTLSLNRGGLSQVDPSTFGFFCFLELSIRPFLNLASFRSSSRKSDSELLEQLIDNSPLLKQKWPYALTLPAADSNFLLKLFVNLYFRIRKWAYLKVFKEQRKVKERLASLTSSHSVELHGKDSIRKALMSSNSV